MKYCSVAFHGLKIRRILHHTRNSRSEKVKGLSTDKALSSGRPGWGSSLVGPVPRVLKLWGDCLVKLKFV